MKDQLQGQPGGRWAKGESMSGTGTPRRTSSFPTAGSNFALRAVGLLVFLALHGNAMAQARPSLPSRDTPLADSNSAAEETRASSQEVPGLRSVYFVVASRSEDKMATSKASTRGVAFAYEEDSSTCTVVTAAHVVKGAVSINVYLWTEESSPGAAFEARIAWIDDNSDIAALTIRGTKECEPVARYDAPVPIGRRVFAFLNAPHARGMVTSGYIGGFWLLNGMGHIVCDMQVQTGHSGSPLFDSFGRLLGMVASKANTLEVNAGFAIPAKRIQAEFAARKALASRPEQIFDEQ